MEFLHKDEEEEFLNTLASLEGSVQISTSSSSSGTASGRTSPPLTSTPVWGHGDRVTPSPSISAIEEEILDFDFLDMIMHELDDTSRTRHGDTHLPKGFKYTPSPVCDDTMDRYVDFFSLSGEADQKQKQLQANLKYQGALTTLKLKIDDIARENQEFHKKLTGILSITVSQTVQRQSKFTASASSIRRDQLQQWGRKAYPPNLKFNSPNEEWANLIPSDFLPKDPSPDEISISIWNLKLNWLWTRLGEEANQLHNWSPQDRKFALRAIIAFVQKKLTSNVLSSKDNKNIQDLTRKLDDLQKLSNRDILTMVENDSIPIDWVYVSRMIGGRHSPQACEQLWINILSPKIKCSKWNQAEIEKLIKLMSFHKRKTKKRMKESDEIKLKRNPDLLTWEEITKELPGRTPQECIIMWIQNLLPEVENRSDGPEWKERRWNKREDELLNNAILLCGEDWEAVSMMVPGRNRHQCATRFLKSLEPQIKKGRWSEEENLALRAAVNSFGIGSWTKIAAQVPGRNDIQCRERWVNVLDPLTNRSPFTAEEDQKILKGVAKFGEGKWSSIAQLLPGRTDNMVSRRYKYLAK